LIAQAFSANRLTCSLMSETSRLEYSQDFGVQHVGHNLAALVAMAA